MAVNVRVTYVSEVPENGPWILYAPEDFPIVEGRERCVWVAHCEKAWSVFETPLPPDVEQVDGLACVVQHSAARRGPFDVAFDLVVNALYFLSCWSERAACGSAPMRGLYRDSLFARADVPQDVVDTYLMRLLSALNAVCEKLGLEPWAMSGEWPSGSKYALVLSHDVDFIPYGKWDILLQGAKSLARHLVSHRDPGDALRAFRGLARALLSGRDPYGCIPEIIAREKSLGVRASFQVAVGHRHRADVKYRIEDDSIRDYVAAVTDAGFDLCLHGSYRSTENVDWYVEEARLLERRVCKPVGSRQHFLSFIYDNLFLAQERACVQYDMSIGYPDYIGPRAGFSYPFFPYCLDQDRPYDVVEIGLLLMDVTLRSYMKLKGDKAWEVMETQLDALRTKGGCASIVWHPIVFGGARDPGDAELFWQAVAYARDTDGLATDGRAINSIWRDRARGYSSFINVSEPER